MEKTSATIVNKGLASEIADIKVRQALVLDYSDWLLSRVDRDEMIDELSEMREDDEKNLRLIENMEVQHGVTAQPKPAAMRHVELAREILIDPRYSFLEKVAEFGLLKTMQNTCGMLVARSMQIADPDVRLALGGFAAVNADNMKHMKWITTMTNVIGTRQITGSEEEPGLWGRVREMFTAAAGAIGAGVAEPLEDLPITSVLAMDHRKVDALFVETLSASTYETAREHFESIYKDLSVHAAAEEDVFYRALQDRGVSDLVLHAYDEHGDMKMKLEEIRSMPGTFEEFKRQVKLLQQMVSHHVREEEGRIFDSAKATFSENELVVLCRRFMQEKKRVQDDMLDGRFLASAGTRSAGMSLGARSPSSN